MLYPLFAFFIAIGINFLHFKRNYEISNHTSIVSMSNELQQQYLITEHAPKLLVTSAFKEVGLQMGPYPLNRWYDKLLIFSTKKMGVDINAPSISYLHMAYKGAPVVPNHEDNAPNYIHFFFDFYCYNFFNCKVG